MAFEALEGIVMGIEREFVEMGEVRWRIDDGI
jgi:hypothetical protein